jgi:hypothetical protein
MVNVGIFYDHLEYFMAICYNFWPFGIVCGHLLYFSQFGMFEPRKIWQPCWIRQTLSRGRCSNYNFLRSFANFRQTNWRFLQKPML